MILGPLSWLVLIAFAVGGWILIQFAKVARYLAVLFVLYLCTQVSLADDQKSQLVIITRTDFVTEGELVPHADCLKAGAERMRNADGDVIGFLCEPERIVAVCKDPAENCA